MFIGTLFPALGFFNAYSFRYSFVNDHHQYLASLGMIALVSAGVASWSGRWRLGQQTITPWLCLALLAILATLTWRQSRMYRDSDTLWLTTIHRNPQCWMALGNFGHDLLQRGQVDEAIPHLQKALALNPEFDFGQADLGTGLLQKGQVDEAIPHLQKALALEPKLALVHANLGTALLQKGQVDEAIARFQQALAIQPDLYLAHNSLGNALLQKGRVDEALDHFQAALKLRPDFAEAHNNLGNALLRKGQVKEAIAQYQAAIETQPANAFLRSNLAWVLATCPEPAIRNGARAVELAQAAERLSGGQHALVLGTLAAAYAEVGRFTEAVAKAQRALELATAQADTAQVEAFRARLALYQAGSPFRDTGLLPQGKTVPRN